MIVARSPLFRIVFALLAFLVCSPGFSQSVTPQNELDKKYTPNENSIFNGRGNSERTRSVSGEDKPDVTIANAVKFIPTSLFRFKTVFQYERKLFNPVTLVIGTGKAFGTDVIESLGSEFATFRNNSSTDLTYNDIESNSSFKRGRLILHVGAKIYFSGKAFDGSYVEFNYRRDRIEHELTPTINSIRVDGDNVALFTTSGFSFGYGYMGTAGPKNNITHEFFFNFGIKNVSFSRFEKAYVGTPLVSGGNNDYVYRRTVGTIDYRIVPSINIGYIFGFGF